METRFLGGWKVDFFGEEGGGSKYLGRGSKSGEKFFSRVFRFFVTKVGIIDDIFRRRRIVLEILM